jgi:hypothetical protein
MGRFKRIANQVGQTIDQNVDQNLDRSMSPKSRWSTTRRPSAVLLGLLTSLTLGSALGIVPAPSAQAADRVTVYTLSQSLSWGNIVDWLSRRKVAGTSRGDSLCPIAPNFDEQVWSLQPSVFWQGDVAAIGLRRIGDEQPLWKQTIAPSAATLNHLRYSGRLLQPGQVYEWLFFQRAESSQPTKVSVFRVMKAADRNTVRLALAQLPGRGEALAQARVAYFSDQSLGADALAEMVAVPQPSAELQQILKTLPDRLCKP